MNEIVKWGGILLLLTALLAGCQSSPTPAASAITAVIASATPSPTPTTVPATVTPTATPTSTAAATAQLPWRASPGSATASATPQATHTPTLTSFKMPTPGPTATPFPGLPLASETVLQGHIGLSGSSEKRWPFPPAFFVFATSTEWDDFNTIYHFRGGTGDAINVFQSISTDFDFDNNLLILGLMHVGAIPVNTDYRILGAWQDEDNVYIRVAWESTSNTSFMSEGTMYIMAGISRPNTELGQELTFTFVSQWPPYYDGLGEQVEIVEKSLP